mmetsp:Transcript_19903/g.39437  ORF Transcript_19903/g.39437 Transcript_19903/m.39437 type:complete len:200 (+) Transcript_19903:279-878(+)
MRARSQSSTQYGWEFVSGSVGTTREQRLMLLLTERNNFATCDTRNEKLLGNTSCSRARFQRFSGSRVRYRFPRLSPISNRAFTKTGRPVTTLSWKGRVQNAAGKPIVDKFGKSSSPRFRHAATPAKGIGEQSNLSASELHILKASPLRGKVLQIIHSSGCFKSDSQQENTSSFTVSTRCNISEDLKSVDSSEAVPIPPC